MQLRRESADRPSPVAPTDAPWPREAARRWLASSRSAALSDSQTPTATPGCYGHTCPIRTCSSHSSSLAPTDDAVARVKASTKIAKLHAATRAICVPSLFMPWGQHSGCLTRGHRGDPVSLVGRIRTAGFDRGGEACGKPQDGTCPGGAGRPCSAANATACVRLVAPSLARMWLTCTSTVRSET